VGLDYEEAETTAAQLVAREERQRKNKPTRPLQHRPVNHDEITLTNAVPLLIDRIMRLAERAYSDPLPRPERQRVPFVQKKASPGDAFPPTQPTPTPQPVTNDEVLAAAFPLVVSTGTGCEFIPDGEYHTSLFDQTTSNWRQSILDNERRAREREERRRSRWIG
jgi:hypothetical protein